MYTRKVFAACLLCITLVLVLTVRQELVSFKSNISNQITRQVQEVVDTLSMQPEVDRLMEGEPSPTSPINITALLQSIRLCTQEERIQHMKKMCAERYDVARFLDPTGRSLVDHKHKMTFCWMSKAGGTSLKAFILEANGLDLSKRDRQEDSLNQVHFVETVNKYGLEQMYQLNKTTQRNIVDEYLNTMGIRHPFDRLVAYYRDKIVDTDRSSNHPKRVREILQEFRPGLFVDNSTLQSMEWPQQAIGVPTFGETMAWVYKHKQMDEHWNFITDVCHPCAHDWAAIFRVETMEQDGHLLAKLVNSSHESIPVRHSHQHDVSFLEFGKTLDQFREVPDEVINYFLEFYRTDMTTFGYRWDRQSRTAYCAIDTPTGLCC